MLTTFIKIACCLLQYASIYSFSFTDIDGNTVNMSGFEGKKILLVNTALGSNNVAQLAALQALQQQHSTALVVIVFPSDDFGNEPNSNAQISEAIRNTNGGTYLIAAKTNVKPGTGTHPIFQWLADKEQNGRVQATPGNDFYKFLIDEQGYPAGIFSSRISPDGEAMDKAINTPSAP